MDDFGAALKDAREARGISLKEIAYRTKISTAALEGLERNDFSKLPGGIFGRAFVRAYALEVGLDADETVEAFLVHLGQFEREAAARKAVRADVTADDQEFLERQRQAIRWLRASGLAVAVLICALVGWRIRAYALAHSVHPAPLAASPSSSDVAPAHPADVALTDTPDQAAAPEALVVQLTVTANCWVSIGSDGNPAEGKVLKGGETETVSAAHDLAIELGNAGAVAWTINGKTANPLGKAGQHVRVHLTPATAATFLR